MDNNIRYRSVSRVLSGERPLDVARSEGISSRSVRNWVRGYEVGGWESVSGPHHRVTDRKYRLSAEQIKSVYDILKSRNPDDFGLGLKLWTRNALTKLISERFRASFESRDAHALLSDIGFELSDPLRSYQARRSSGVIRSWSVSQIRSLLPKKDLKNPVLFDMFQLRDCFDLIDFPADGSSRVVRKEGSFTAFLVLYVVDTRRAVRFLVVKSPLSSACAIDFLNLLAADIGRPVSVLVPSDRPWSEVFLKPRDRNLAPSVALIPLGQRSGRSAEF